MLLLRYAQQDLQEEVPLFQHAIGRFLSDDGRYLLALEEGGGVGMHSERANFQ